MLLKEGVPLKEINTKLDNAYKMARDNILRKAKTPQLKNLFDAWWRATEDLLEGQAGQDDTNHKQNADRGEAGTGKPKA